VILPILCRLSGGGRGENIIDSRFNDGS